MARKVASEIANTILEQMGGSRRLALMIGAKNFLSIPAGDKGGLGGLRFDFPQPGAGKPNSILIHLMPSDTYTVRFALSRSVSYKILKEYEDIYAEDLGGLFTRTTGLHLRLASTYQNRMPMGYLALLHKVAGLLGWDRLVAFGFCVRLLDVVGATEEAKAVDRLLVRYRRDADLLQMQQMAISAALKKDVA